MFEGQLGESIVDALPDRHGRDGSQLVGRDFDAEVELSLLTRLHDFDFVAARPPEKLRDQFNRVLRRRQANS